jgi:hypothetical protein
MAGYTILSASRQALSVSSTAAEEATVVASARAAAAAAAAATAANDLTANDQAATTAQEAAANDESLKVLQSAAIVAPSTSSSSIFSFQRVIRDFPPECSIFMAPSSIKSHPGLGIFTTRDIAQGTPFLQAPDGPSIPVVGLDRVPDTDAGFRKIVKQFTGMYVHL